MALPTDRGYVTITDTGDGTQRVDVYARMSPSGPTHMYASHTGVTDVAIMSRTPFARHGRTTVSSTPVEVSFNDEENRLYIFDVARTSPLLR